MRNLLIAAAVVLLAALGYYQFSVVPAQRAAEQAATAAKAAADAAAAEAAATAKAAEEAAAAAAKAATDAAAGAASAVTDAATGAAGAVSDAATGAAGAVSDAATGAAAAVSDAASQIWDATKLTSTDILARIANAPVSQQIKDTLTATYNSVKDNPAAVQTVLDDLKKAIGL